MRGLNLKIRNELLNIHFGIADQVSQGPAFNVFALMNGHGKSRLMPFLLEDDMTASLSTDSPSCALKRANHRFSRV